jgi:hypothetical protein
MELFSFLCFSLLTSLNFSLAGKEQKDIDVPYEQAATAQQSERVVPPLANKKQQ